MTVTGGRPRSTAGHLARLGFLDPARAATLLGDSLLRGVIDAVDGQTVTNISGELADVADPDLALMGLVRLLQETGQDFAQAVGSSARLRAKLFAVLGSSTALADHLVRHPMDWAVFDDQDLWDAGHVRADLLSAVGADPHAADPRASFAGVAGRDILRARYRRWLLAIAGRDLIRGDGLAVLPQVGRELAELAGATLETALAVARADLPPDAPPCRLAVIAMGKCGGQELNYISDIDVIFVAEPLVDSVLKSERAALETATRLASGLMRVCAEPGSEPALWPVDAGLRPEGAQGPLVRTLDSHLAYYQRWANTWEFQALLKARPVAGDQALGAAYMTTITPLVWQAAGRDGFVPEVQQMRRRVEEHIPAREADRQLKLGPGGLRDVEFSVQLLQLVHGRTDPSLRSATTLEALAALADGGYVGRDDAAALGSAYRLLRVLEHRIQLFRMRRTHLIPTEDLELRRLGRQLGHRVLPARAVVAQWRTQSREVRRLHERLFYRPLLDAVAALSADDVRMSPTAAHARFHALGYADPVGALRHVEALTSGVSRRSAIQRHLVPVMLGWFADEADPDAGLLAFRRISDELGATHWYLKMLRDTASAAQRLAIVLGRSRFAADLLIGASESVQVLGDDSGLRPRSREHLLVEVSVAADRVTHPDRAATAVRSVRRRELFRIATADLLGQLDVIQVGWALTDVAAAVLSGVLRVAIRRVERDVTGLTVDGALPTRMVVMGMGRLGGAELGYGSDADVLFIHDPLPGVDHVVAQRAAVAVVGEFRRLLAAPGPDPVLALDAALRPEGKQGPVVQSLTAYAAYYQRWSLPWEAQALLRATPIAGDEEVAERFTTLVDEIRWPAHGLPDAAIREIRRIKARVESERLPRGVDPARHVKLGRGGLADVEWTVQLLQLQYAHAVPGLRSTQTTTALHAAVQAGLVDEADAAVLTEAWVEASRLRNAAVLARGRATDVLPTDLRELEGISRALGYLPNQAAVLREDHARRSRHARAVMERLFYE
ncbi:MAG: bifunctional [glutamine synthetase] adenylyltransferase/[glutamine synthetase]-adenylyl-L-tyrosine phosphorylase [Actinomycetota bacterium]